MKLFFAVLAAVLAAGFISWMTLSLAKIAQHRAVVKQQYQDAGIEPAH